MPEHYKALIVVIAVTLAVFYFARPFAMEFMAPENFKRRRNIWLCLLVAAFLIPNYWLYVLVATVVIGFGVRRDPNPVALYLFLLLAVPPFGADIPTFGLINQVFPLDHLRLLSMIVLLPTAMAFARAKTSPAAGLPQDASGRGSFRAADLLIILFCALQLAVWLPYDTVVATIRRASLFGLDILLPYFVVSRACRNPEVVREAMASFVLVMLTLACIAVFESLKGWLLFASLEDTWDTLTMTTHLRRGNALRAQATGGHSIVLAYAFMVGLGFWLALSSRVASPTRRAITLLVLIAGLGATLARGPWIGALLVLILFRALGPQPLGRVMKLLGLFVGAAIVLWLTPWGASAVDRLPFIGNDEEGSVGYRQQLAALSWSIIQMNPFFGTLNFMQYMEQLRQGEGIIDLVNAYAGIALAFGLVGLSLFVGFFLTVAADCFGAVRRLRSTHLEDSLTGVSVLACIGAALVVLATVGQYLSVSNLTWALAGLAGAYARFSPRFRPEFGRA